MEFWNIAVSALNQKRKFQSLVWVTLYQNSLAGVLEVIKKCRLCD